MLENVKKGGKISGEKIFAGQRATFSYEFDENQTPANITINTPINVVNESGNSGNGYLNLNVTVSNRTDAKTALLALVDGIFSEIDDLLAPIN